MAELEVLGLSMPRCGSLSLYMALTELGYANCFHNLRIDREEDVKVWGELIKKKYVDKLPICRADLDRVTYGRGAVLSAPYWAFWEELMLAYPKAKIIIVDRDYESWISSIAPVLNTVIYSPWNTFPLRYLKRLVVGTQDVEVLGSVVPWYFNAHTLDQFSSRSRPVFEAHYENIRNLAAVQNRSILQYRLGSGWKPLCDYLEKPIPESPFPSANARPDIIKTLATRKAKERRRAYITITAFSTLLTVVAIAGYSGSEPIVTLAQSFKNGRRWIYGGIH